MRRVRTIEDTLDRIADVLEGGSSGGGDSSGGGSMLVTISVEDGTTKRFDKTAGEVINALNSGTIVRFVEFIEREDPSPEGHGLWKNYTLASWAVYSDDGSSTGECITFVLIEYESGASTRPFDSYALDDYPEAYIG